MSNTHTHTHKYKKNNLPKKEKKTTPDQHPSSTHLRSIIALGLSAVETHSNLRFAPLEQGHFPCHLLPLFVCVCVCVCVCENAATYTCEEAAGSASGTATLVDINPPLFDFVAVVPSGGAPADVAANNRYPVL